MSKRSADQAGLEPSTAPVASTSTAAVSEWQPAAGESPAEREKRIKREKRAARLGVSVEHLTANPVAPLSVPVEPVSTAHRNHYAHSSSGSFAGASSGAGAPPTDENVNGFVADGVGHRSIHPSRLAAPVLAKEERAASGAPKEKTAARKRYLKNKLKRAKGRKAGAPKPRDALLDGSNAGDDSFVTVDGDDDDSDGESSPTAQSLDPDALARKQALIAEKKAQRKEARQAKKAEIKAAKAAGIEVEKKPAPRIIAPKPTAVATVATATTAKTTKVVPPPPEEKTEEEKKAEEEAEKERLELLARKEAKRAKRAQRRLSPPLEPEPSPTAEEEEEAKEESDVDMADKEEAEPAALLRLPGATRPAPPSAATLSALKVHASVRNKRVINPELRLPLNELGVSARGLEKLAEMGFDQAFAVQTALLPLLLPPIGQPTTLYSPFNPPQDVCVSAPTGSGKTLSYVVPIVETLAPRVVTRLRAIVLLPTRDLVGQVRETFETFAKGTQLKVGIATGQHSFAQEQSLLVSSNTPASAQGGSSLVDILIATPGRLMDHLRQTAGFSLQHLRYLVVDEADRLLTQSFQDWLPSILGALKPPASLSSADNLSFPPATSDALAPEWWDASLGRVPSDLDERMHPSCQKLLFSATLSRDPAKIAALHLHRPVYISVEDEVDPHAEDDVDGELKFTFPATLRENMIFSPATHKPLYLFHLLHTLELRSALCFTKSVEAATRLAKLVEFFEDERCRLDSSLSPATVRAYSSDLPGAERNRLLASFKKGEVQMLICSDLIARGIDLPDVSHVLSYDIPADMRKYVHRVGRTARAGKDGAAWSLVEDQEAAPFKKMMKAASHLDKIKRVRVADTEVEPFVPAYQNALKRLQDHFATGRTDRAE